MLVLDYPRTTEVDSPSILVPPFHTGHLGFIPDTPVHFGIVTPQRTHSEVVVAPFSQDWQYLAAVAVTMLDAPGVVSRLVTAVASLDINIETQESASVNHLDHHAVNLIVDFSSSPSLSRIPETPVPIQRLYRQYSAQFTLSDFRFVHLFEAIMAYCADVIVWNRDRVSGDLFPDVSVRGFPYRPVAHTSASVVERADRPLQTRIAVPPTVAVPLRAALGVSDQFQYISVSDTATRSLRVFFLHPSAADALFHIGVYHDDVPGALAAILTLLREAKFNILTSLTRKQPAGRSVWEALVHYVGGVRDIPDPGDRVAHSRPTREEVEWVRQRIAESCPGSAADFERYRLRLGSPQYPKRKAEGATGKYKPTQSVDHPDPVTLDLSDGSGPARNEQRLSIAAAIAEVRERVDAAELEDEVTERIDDLLTTIDKRSELGEHPTIFVSYPHSAEAMVKKLLLRLEEWYIVKCYQKPDGKLILDEAMRLIEESDYFIGIWHPDTMPTRRGRTTKDLSPWLPFEYGVARARDKGHHVVHCDALHAAVWRRVEPGVASPGYAAEAFVDEMIPDIVQFCRSNFR